MTTRPRYRIRGAELFAAGTHRGKTYTLRDLDQMVENFRRLSTGPNPRLRVPGKIGHAEHQDMDESGKPAAGWFSRVWRRGNVLMGDIEDMAQPEAEDIASRRFRKMSAEVYDDFEGHGKTLRAAAFLGGDQPQVKGLVDVPEPERYAERFASAGPFVVELSSIRALPGGVFSVFSEVRPMQPDELVEKLAQHGMNPQVLQGASPELLAEICRVCEDKDQSAGQYDEDRMDRMHGAMMDEQMPDDEQGMQPYRERAHKYASRACKYFERVHGKKFAEDDGDADDKDKKKDDAMPFSEAALKRIVEEAVAKQAGGELARLQKFAEEQTRTAKRQAVAGLVEDLVKSGRVPPAEKAAEVETLLLLDDQTVHKFSEGGKEIKATAFDRRVTTLKKRSSRFGEVIGGGKPGVATPEADDEEVAKVERFSESAEMSHALKAAGKTPQQYVEQFKTARKANPELTAARYGVRS